MATRHGNGDLRTRILKTLNDEVLSKAELAISAINSFELRYNRLQIPHNSFILSTAELAKSYQPHTIINQSVEERVNLVGQAMQYYRIDCSGKIFPLRVQFRQVRNTLMFYGSFKNPYPDKQNCEYNFEVGKQFRKNITPRPEKNVDNFYIGLSSNSKNVAVASLKIEFYNERLELMRKGSNNKTARATPTKSYSLDRFGNQQNSIEKQQPTKSMIGNTSGPRDTTGSFKIRSRSGSKLMTTSVNFVQRNWREAKRHHTSSQEKLMMMTQRVTSKQVESQARKKDIDLLKEKEREFKEKVTEYKELITIKEKKIQEEAYQRRKLTRDLTTFVHLINMLSYVDRGKNKFCLQLSNESRMKTMHFKFYKQLKLLISKQVSLISNRKNRLLADLRSGTYLTAHTLQKSCMNKGSRVLCRLLEVFNVTTHVNAAFEQATSFRRKLRYLQKMWQVKYWTRLQTLKKVAQQHLKKMLTQHAHLRQFEEVFIKQGYLQNVCKEYVKQIALKFNFLHQGYLRRLDEIDNMIRTNLKIKEQNTKLLKKRQKPLLKIPHQPKQPYYRFYRDIEILRSMIRTWFQLQYKKFQRKQRVRLQSTPLP